MDFPFDESKAGCSGLFMKIVHLYWRLTDQPAISDAVKALCRKHDWLYYTGGTRYERVKADAELMLGVALLGRPVLARLMPPPIGIFGHPWWPFSFAWGFGWKWRKRLKQGYAPTWVQR